MALAASGSSVITATPAPAAFSRATRSELLRRDPDGVEHVAQAMGGEMLGLGQRRDSDAARSVGVGPIEREAGNLDALSRLHVRAEGDAEPRAIRPHARDVAHEPVAVEQQARRGQVANAIGEQAASTNAAARRASYRDRDRGAPGSTLFATRTALSSAARVRSRTAPRRKPDAPPPARPRHNIPVRAAAPARAVARPLPTTRNTCSATASPTAATWRRPASSRQKLAADHEFPDPPSNHDSFTNGPVAVQVLANDPRR